MPGLAGGRAARYVGAMRILLPAAVALVLATEAAAQSPDAPVCSFKCDPERFAELLEREGVVPAPYLARAHWVALQRWNALTDPEITAATANAYERVRATLPKKVQAALAGS